MAEAGGARIAPILAGLGATLVGVGLQRFAYAPLLPAMVRAGWVSAAAGGALGAANLGGYLSGALLAPSVGRALGVRQALRLAMLLIGASFAACAWRGGFVWLLPWRILAGAAGGVLMVLAGPAVQAAVAPAMRGLAGGLVVAGVGIGIIVGAALVPAMLAHGLSASWGALAAAALLVSALAWRGMPDAPPPPRRTGRREAPSAEALRLLALYALAAVAAAPFMLWWPDFIIRGLGRGTGFAAGLWLIYGLAAAAGPALFGRLADRIGCRRSLAAALLAQALALALPLLSASGAALLLATALAGATAIGLTALALTRAREVAGAAAPALWSTSTAAYGAAQTLTGFALAWLYARSGSHLPLFAVGLLAGLLALPLTRRG